MLSNSMDALGAFSHLSENLPSWITQLSDLRSHTASKRQEYIDAFKIHGTIRKRERKNSSVCSIRTDDPGKLDPGDVSTQGTADAIHDGAHNHAGGLGQSSVGARYNLIIHYDGHTQKVLEEIVRSIGTARSNIRRGRMAQLPLTGFRSGGMLSKTMMAANSSNALLNKVEDSNDLGARSRPPPKDPPFESADKLLEVAHSYCESAAYAFLRVGDCGMEINGIEENLNSLLGMATAEVERLAEQRKEEQSDMEEDSEEEEAPAAESTKLAADDDDKPPQAPSGAIEVDDDASSASSASIDMSAFRTNRLSRF
ncbi:hypothetical protein PHISP_07327 [Aspergillus sp. HF37]|nr:hypothetical protein PHISP_07327 [Aspergillus sp. HF37]